MRTTHRSRLLALGLTGALVLAACGGDSGTSETAGAIGDPQGVGNDVDGLLSGLGVQQVGSVSRLVQTGGGALLGLSHGHGPGIAALLSVRPKIVTRGRGMFAIPGLEFPRTGLPRGADGHVVTQGDVIDDIAYGRSYSYNPVQGFYQDDGNDAGPADGVRFTLYALDANDDIIPGTVIGMLDLHDLSTPSTSDLGVVILGTGASPPEYLNYHVALPDTYDPNTGAFDVLSDGDVGNGAVNFDVHYTRTDYNHENTTINISNTNTALAVDAAFGEEINGDQALDLVVHVAAGTQTIAVVGTQTYDATLDDVNTDVALEVNGQPYATAVTETANGTPIWLNTHGEHLPAKELALLDRIFTAVFNSVDAVFFLVVFTLYLVA